ncbi:MAG: PucR family transcriptional regulator ligand-binding domain-containing protein [Clostridiales bacterium]|nr:PucR family transcriptional regulator ligand-binding domain-containing protein [Clostridiales bacterium]
MINSFGLSVEELLNLDIMKDAKVLSGRGGLDRRIAKMNVMEVPDILDWVLPGEFLLTTAYSIKDDIDQLEGLISKLNEKKISGIGIKMKRYIKEIPDAIIKASDEFNFPIIEIPYDVSFSDIIMPALTEIINRQANTLTEIYDFHNRLIDIILKGGSLQEISDAIFRSIGNPVIICENIFKTHVTSSKEDISGEIGHIFSEDYHSIDFLSQSNIKLKDKFGDKEVERVIIPIKVDETIYGYINIWELNRSLTAMEITVITSSTSIITLDLLKKLSIFQIENKNRSEFFDNLFSKDDKLVQKAIDSKIFYDYKPNDAYTVMIVNAKNEDTGNGKYFIEKLTQIIDQIIVRREDKIIYANSGHQIIMLVGSSLKNVNLIYEMNGKIAKEILNNIDFVQDKNTVTIGIGRQYEDIMNVRNSYHEALRVLDYLTSMDGICSLHFDDLGIFRILSYNELKPELHQFYSEILKPLVEYDIEKGHELVDTLKKFFEFRGNIKKVSDAMYTHYNTIVYRMNRIKEITKMDFDDSNDYLNMQIAIKIYEILN